MYGNNSSASLWETIVKALRGSGLDAFADEVIDVIYSKDGAMRYVILKDENGRFTYQYEAICQCVGNEWKFICSPDDSLPAMWEPYKGVGGNPVFASIEELLDALKSEAEYGQYFD